MEVELKVTGATPEMMRELAKIMDPGSKTEPAKTEPAKTEPAKTEPAKTEPAKTEQNQGPKVSKWLTEPIRQATGDYSSEERDEIKAELDALGVDYNARCGSHTLHEEIVKFSRGGEAPESKAEAEPAPEPKAEAEPTEEVTIEQLKPLLFEYVKANSKDKGLALLQKHGAKMLSELTPEGRVAVMQEINA